MIRLEFTLAAADWGSVPAWLSSLAAVLALIFAATAAVLSRRTFGIQSSQYRAGVEAERRAQASLVSVWWGWRDSGAGEWGAYVRNASQAPIYQAHIAFVRADDRRTVTKIGLDLIPPSDRPSFYRVSDTELERCRTRLTFTDATGARWIRDEYGRLDCLRSELVMWVGDDIAKIFIEFRADIQSSYGVDVKLDITDVGERLRRKYIAEARQAGNVDVFVGPHDWVGELVSEQAVEPVALSEEQRQNLLDFSLQPFCFNGDIYGIPATMDTVMLIINVDLVGDEPSCFEEVVEVGRALQRANVGQEIIVVRVGPEGDPFLIWPLLSSGGAWLFGMEPNGAWDIHQVGIDSPESISAFERIAALGEAGEGIIRCEMDQAWVERTFIGGTCPFMLGAYGDVARARDAGMNVVVSPVPGFRDGGPARSFTTIYGFYIAPFGRNRVIASDLLPDYLTGSM